MPANDSASSLTATTRLLRSQKRRGPFSEPRHSATGLGDGEALGKIAVVAGAANVGKSLLVIALPRDCVLLSFAGLPGPFVRHLERQLKLVAKLFAIRKIQLVLLDKELAVHLVGGVFDQKLILVPG
jgi:hypothetical protein